MIRKIRPFALACVLALSYVASGHAAGQKGGPFAPYVGTWAGVGAVRSATGDKEAICHATQVAQGDNGRLDLFCISGNVGLDLTINMTAQGGALDGGWRENVSGNTGTLSGKVGNRTLSTLAHADGNDFSIVIQAPTDQRVLRVGVATTSSFLTRGAIVLQPTSDDVEHFAAKLQAQRRSQGQGQEQ